jgi:type IV secretory pathway VirB2 component (pilin)
MFIQTARAAGVIDDAPTVATVLTNVFTFLLQVAGIIGIIGIAFAGILYLTANGNPKQIDKAKKITVATIVGVVILFASLVILKTVAGFFG